MILPRRAALLGISAVPFLNRASLGQGAPAVTAAGHPSQAPGFYRFRVGGFLVTTVNDGFFDFPVERLVTNAPVGRVQDILRESFLSPTVFHNPFTLTFVETPGGLVMFDSGTGGQMGPNTGRLAGNLRAAGLDLTQVRTVVFSHFHADHVTGLTTPGDSPTLPNAEIVVPEAEWAFWTDAGNLTRSPDFQRGNFANVARRFAPYLSRVRRFAPGAEVVPGVHAIAAPGHSPGHTIYRIADDGEQAIFLADTTHRPELFVRHPELHAIIDFDPETAETTRRQVLDMVATDRVRVTAYHYPFPANGYIAKDGAGYRFVPANWTSAV